jgi:hypothetical protein
VSGFNAALIIFKFTRLNPTALISIINYNNKLILHSGETNTYVNISTNTKYISNPPRKLSFSEFSASLYVTPSVNYDYTTISVYTGIYLI